MLEEEGPFIVITGPRGSGKSNFLKQLAHHFTQKNYQCGGYYQPVIYNDNQRQGYDIVSFFDSQRLVLARRNCDDKCFTFASAGFTGATNWLAAAWPLADLFFIDEAGFIEADGGGHFSDIYRLVEARRPLVIAAREDTLPRLLARMPYKAAAIIKLPGGEPDSSFLSAALAALQAILPPPPPPLDMAENFARMVRRRSAALPVPPGAEEHWQARARDYDKRAKDADDGGLLAYLRSLVRPEDIFLDIGAGTGRHALVMAGYCQKVVALEPSAAMSQILEDKLAAAGITNLQLRRQAWPEAAEKAMADVVFSSHVLYGQLDPLGFVRAMTMAGRRLAILALAVTPSFQVLDTLRAELMGRDIPPAPALPEAWRLLRQMGLNPQYYVFPESRRAVKFSLEADSLNKLARRLGLPEIQESYKRLADILPKVGDLQEDGTYLLGYSGPNGLLVWNGQG